MQSAFERATKLAARRSAAADLSLNLIVSIVIAFATFLILAATETPV